MSTISGVWSRGEAGSGGAVSICTKCSKEASNYLHCPHCGAAHRALVLPPKVSSPRAPTTVLTPAQERAARAAKRAADWERLTPTQKKLWGALTILILCALAALIVVAAIRGSHYQ